MQLRRRKLLRLENNIRLTQVIEIVVEDNSGAPDLVARRRTRIRRQDEKLRNRHLQRFEIINRALERFGVIVGQSEDDQRVRTDPRVHDPPETIRIHIHGMKSLVNVFQIAC